MENLDEMKEFWKKSNQKDNNNNNLNNKQIMETISKKSNSIFEKLKSSVALEFLVLIICLPAFCFGVYYYQSSTISVMSAIMIIICGIYVAIFWKDFKQIRGYEVTSDSIRTTLSEVIVQLERFKDTYFKLCMVLWPFVGIAHSFMSEGSNIPRFDNKTTNIVAYAVLSTILGYVIQKWYTNYMYGRHITQLKKLKTELEQV
jgi:hypothetical protein